MKRACYDHFKKQLIDADNAQCDILASQNGPSCAKLAHIKNFKVIYVRFVSGKPPLESKSILSTLGLQNLRVSRQTSSKTTAARLSPIITTSTVTNPRARNTTNKENPTSSHDGGNDYIYPKSISITKMLKIGTAIPCNTKKPTTIKLREFDVEALWNPFYKTTEMTIDELPFAKGGFRSVYKAKCKDGKDYVVKRFLDETLDKMKQVNEVIEKNETPETLARKAIQAHMLALNFAEQLHHFVQHTCAKDFGKTFQYQKSFLGIIENSGETECVMVEPFIPGKFEKYLNNNGVPVRGDVEDFDLVEKAMCLAHFSFEKSDGKLLLLDIQGADYALYDPEFATSENAIDASGGLRFCMGNLSTEATVMFTRLHNCNMYCKMVGLTPLSKKSEIDN